jgi:hypothetical protein
MPSTAAKVFYTIRLLFFVSVLASLVMLVMAVQVLNTYAISNYRFYTDSSMFVLQHMYDTSTGLWKNALWWQQANALETTIDRNRASARGTPPSRSRASG